MANNVVAFGGKKVSDAFRGVIDAHESLSDGIGGGFGALKYRGKEWSLEYRGETYAFADDEGNPARHLDLIIVRQAKNKSKTYYPEFVDGANSRPTCSSMDGITPDPHIPEPQAKACALCPMNVMRTNEKGFNSKPCSDLKRMAVLLLPETSEKVLGEPLMEPVLLRVPAGSLTNLGRYGDYLRQTDNPYIGVVTRVSFERGKTYPKLEFHPQALLDDDNAAVVVPMYSDPLTLRIIGEGPRQMAPAIAAPQEPPAVLPVAKTNLVQFAKKAEPKVVEAEIIEPAPKKPVVDPRPQMKAAPVEADDAEESDADLDSRLNSLINL